MKRRTRFAFTAALALLAGTAHAGDVGFTFGINVGNRPVPVRYEPAYAPVYTPAPAPIIISEPPEFVVPPRLGFRVAVDLPYDLFAVGGNYYLFRDASWYCAPSYRGPWRTVEYRRVPWELRRYPLARVRDWRDREWRHRCDDGDHDRSDWRGEERRHWREAREWDHGGWRHARHDEDDD
ncbi:hypothetical protein [Geobacter pickeringii]|uniref:Uncharacterized protein n=1 Tax=Geobacter pickeringii TaxID=345632 RepID=A0A0B5B6C1_9BACT|nr:hypothetical protein [Geobacter pickeringii]AJE02087.1 hypothetical protein GPICK_00670 [Geobacter pickeringii]